MASARMPLLSAASHFLSPRLPPSLGFSPSLSQPSAGGGGSALSRPLLSLRARSWAQKRRRGAPRGSSSSGFHVRASRINALHVPEKNMDDVDEFERQLRGLFLEIRTKLEGGEKDDALYILQANYEAVKEQIDSGSNGIEQAALLDVLALGYLGAGNFKTVEHLLDMLKVIVVGLHDDLPFIDSILMHMGSMYTTLGKFEDAISVHERGLKIVEKLFGDNSPFLITPLMGMAKALNLLGRTSEAIILYNRATTVLEKSKGMESEDLVAPLSVLGNLYINEGKATDAEACYKRVIKIYQNLYGGNDGRVGMALCSLAHALCAKGSVGEAISMYEEGLHIIKCSKYMALDDDLLDKMRTDLAELLHSAGREQEGRKLLEECLLISERSKGMDHPSSLAHLLNIATSHSRSKNFVEAERLLRTCLHIASKTVRPSDPSITFPMLQLAVTLYNLKQYEEAESLAMDVVRIREQAFGKEALLVGEALDCLISIQISLGNADDNDILAKLKRVLSIQEKEMGYENEETMTTLKKVMFYLEKLGRRDEKLPLQRRLSMLRDKHNQRVAV